MRQALSILLLLIPWTARAIPPNSPETLERAIADRITKVEQFRLIREEADRMGIRVWLFGGTAAAYAHYVSWDLLRERGDERFQSHRFDYDYTSIFRSTQDLDLVTDGTAEQARRLEAELLRRYPHVQGTKGQWEVRLLKEDLGDKEAILGNQSFLEQHTDSHSTGLVEVTIPRPAAGNRKAEGEPIVRDVKDWEARYPVFFEDVRLSRLNYYFSPTHASTARAKKGLNPPILSVIRYLTKAFQYELAISPGDLERLRSVIAGFDRERDLAEEYVRDWIARNGKKLVQHAVNIEYACEVMDRLGLRDLLASLGDPKNADSLAWWMRKEPLRSRPLGEGSGKTARELDIVTVAHETGTLTAYESITRSHKGEPNVFISRRGAPGELAAQGDGFYTQIGTEGAIGTGLTIRFRLHPDARLGSDFERHGDFVIVTNRNALTVIPEGMVMEPEELFARVGSFRHADLGLIDMMKRRVMIRLTERGPERLASLSNKMKGYAHNPRPDTARMVLRTWFTLSNSTAFPEILETVHSFENMLGFYPAGAISGRSDFFEDKFHVTFTALRDPHWAKTEVGARILIELMKVVMGHETGTIYGVFKTPEWAMNPKAEDILAALLADSVHDSFTNTWVLKQPAWRERLRPLVGNEVTAKRLRAALGIPYHSCARVFGHMVH